MNRGQTRRCLWGAGKVIKSSNTTTLKYLLDGQSKAKINRLSGRGRVVREGGTGGGGNNFEYVMVSL